MEIVAVQICLCVCVCFFLTTIQRVSIVEQAAPSRHVSGAQTCSFFIADEPRRHDLIDLGAYAPCGACAHYTHDRVLQILTLSLCAKSLRGPRRSSSRMVTRILTVTQAPPPPTPFLHHTTRRRLSVAFFSIHPDNALNGQQRWDATDKKKTF